MSIKKGTNMRMLLSFILAVTQIAVLLGLLTTLATCAEAQVPVPTPYERSVGMTTAGVRIVASPGQPGESTDPSLEWKAIPHTTVFAGTGPSPFDVIQGGLEGDCTFLATIAGLAHARPKEILDRTLFVGVTEGGAQVYSILLFDQAGKPVKVYVDDLVLTSGTWLPNDPMIYEPVTNKLIMWSTLWQKAIAKMFSTYERMPHNLDQQLRIVTGHSAQRIDMLQLTPETFDETHTLLDAFQAGRVMTTGTMPNMDFVRDFRMGTPWVITSKLEGDWLTMGTTHGTYTLVVKHAYTVLDVSPSTVTVRNPWGVQDGGDRHGVFGIPRDIFPLLFTSLNLEGHP